MLYQQRESHLGINRLVLDFMAKVGAMIIVTVIFIMAFPLLVYLVFFGEN
jgi:hypothetical protein